MRSKFSPAQSSPANTDSWMGWVIPLSHMHEVLMLYLDFLTTLMSAPFPCTEDCKLVVSWKIIVVNSYVVVEHCSQLDFNCQCIVQS